MWAICLRFLVRRTVLGWIHGRGEKLPADASGEVLSAGDFMAWFRLKDWLTAGKQLYVHSQVAAMVEAELRLEAVRFSVPVRLTDVAGACSGSRGGV
jgi:hypothetical protein